MFIVIYTYTHTHIYVKIIKLQSQIPFQKSLRQYMKIDNVLWFSVNLWMFNPLFLFFITLFFVTPLLFASDPLGLQCWWHFWYFTALSFHKNIFQSLIPFLLCWVHLLWSFLFFYVQSLILHLHPPVYSLSQLCPPRSYRKWKLITVFLFCIILTSLTVQSLPVFLSSCFYIFQ